MGSVRRWAAAAAAMCLLPSSAMPQAAAPPPATITQPPAPGTPPSPAAPSATGSQVARPPLILEPGDPANVDEVVLAEKPALTLAGTGEWDSGLASLREAFARVEAELARIGVAPAGRPIAVFTQRSDDSFRFDAMVPVAAAPSPTPALPAGMRFGTTPSGKAFRFVHRGPYDDIDTTYETVTTYLEVKDIVAKDQFMEEFLTDSTDATDPGLAVNIYVQPR